MLYQDTFIPIAAKVAGNPITGFIVPMVIFFAIMYFLMIRPQKKKNQEAMNMLDNLKPGDRVQMYSGIVGKIIRLGKDDVVIEAEPSGVRLTHMKYAIRDVLNKGEFKEQEVDKKNIGKVVAEDEDFIYEEVSEDASGDDIEYIEVKDDGKK